MIVKMIKIALCNVHSENLDINEPEIRSPHMGLAYLASSLDKNRYQVEIIDGYCQKLSLEQTITNLLEGGYHLIGFTTYACTITNCVRVLSELKKRGCTSKILFGGYHSHYIYTELFAKCESLDYVLLGESDISFKTLLEYLFFIGKDIQLNHITGLVYRKGDELITTSLPILCSDLDALTIPSYKKTATGEYQILASRGCMDNCYFCAAKSFLSSCKGKSLRIRSIESVISEIEYRRRDPNFKRLAFIDDELFVLEKVCPGWITDFVAKIRARNIRVSFSMRARSDSIVKYKEELKMLKSIGLSSVFVGIESLNPDILSEIFNKNEDVSTHYEAITILKELKINIAIGMIILHPYVTLDKLKTDFIFYRDAVGVIGSDFTFPFHRFVKLLLFPGCAILLNRLKKDGLLEELDLGRYDWHYQNKDMRYIEDAFNIWDIKIEACSILIKRVIFKVLNLDETSLFNATLSKYMLTFRKINDDFVEDILTAAYEFLHQSSCWSEQFESIIEKHMISIFALSKKIEKYQLV